MPLSDDQEKELQQAFQLYCIYNPETEHFDKENTGVIATTLLSWVLRAIGLAPSSFDMEKYEKSIGSDTFTVDQARTIAEELASQADTAEEIIAAYDVMASERDDAPGEGMIHKDGLWQKMKRRLGKDYLANQMVFEDAQPNDDGWIDYKAFVQRQYDVRNLSLKEADPIRAPTKDDMTAFLGSTDCKGEFKLEGKYKLQRKDPDGVYRPYGRDISFVQKYDGTGKKLAEAYGSYPYPYKSADDIKSDPLNKGREATRQLILFGDEQRQVLSDAVDNEISNNLVTSKLEELAKADTVLKTQICLRELSMMHTGHKYVDELEATALQVVDDDSIVPDKDKAAIPSLSATKESILAKWRQYGSSGDSY